eukprot:1160193-Pelagomonas_calceolata.AAC.10
MPGIVIRDGQTPSFSGSVAYYKILKEKTRKGDTLAQRAVSLPHPRVRGKLVWVWWVSESMQPQGTRALLSIFDFNGTSRCKFVRIAQNGPGYNSEKRKKRLAKKAA